MIVLDILTGTMEQEKGIKGKGQKNKKKEEAKLSLPVDKKIFCTDRIQNALLELKRKLKRVT